MLNQVASARYISLQYWLRLPHERVRLVRRFLFVAITLSAARIFLYTVGVALFLANEGPSELPRFFILLALITVALSTVLGMIVDRVPKLRLARIALASLMLAAAGGKLLLLAEVPGAYFIILSSAYILEIAIEILFWTACSAYFDTVEIKRATPVICLGVALGGALGGLLARSLAWTIGAPDLLLVMVIFACLAVLQFTMLSHAGELPDRDAQSAEPGEAGARVSSLARLGLRYPLLALVSLNALMLTVLYGIAEFLFLSVYSEHFPSEQELARFLGIVFALLQTCEFVLLVTLSRVLLERASPLLRNLVFPLTSLACLLYLSISDRLSAAVITHLNAEAGSNAIFHPVHNANFLALPLGIQGRARTLSEGAFYPAGLAIAGALLLSMDTAGIVAAAEFVAVLFALVFILLNVGVGFLFPSTLIANLRSGVVPPADLAGRVVRLPASAADRVREFLRSSRSDLRLDGIALSRWLGPAQVGDDLAALASHPDAATRRALVRLASEADGHWARRFTDAAFGRDHRASMVAMQVMLARGEALPAGRLEPLHRFGDPSVLALARLLADGAEGHPVRARLAPTLADPQAAADVIDGIIGARRVDLAEIVAEALPAAPAEQQRHGLEFLHLERPSLPPSAWRPLGRFVRHRDPGVRTQAMALLGGCPHRAPRRALSRGLADRSPQVRRRAADALAAQGEQGIEILVRRLAPIAPGSAEAAGALGRIDTEPARRALVEALRRLRLEARDNARLLGHLAAAPGSGPWLALEICARDYGARIVELALAVLRRSLPRHVFGHVRDALHSEDQRRRANGFEILASLSRSAPVGEAVDTLRVALFGTAAGGQPAEPSARFDAGAALALARASADPWVNEAARMVEARALPAGSSPAPAPLPESDAMIPDEQDLERVLVLKQIPLFRYLPLDALLAVAHSVQPRRYASGDVIAKDGQRLEHCHILEAGVVSIDHGGTTERLRAPAWFNELGLIGEATPTGRILALEPCRVLHLHAVVFQDLSRDHPEILLELCRVLARRVRAAEGAKSGTGATRPADA